MTEQLNQLIEQIKLNLTDYQSQLNNIEIETNKETERILTAIRAEEAEIKSLLHEYRNLKQKNEIEAIRSSFNYLADFKQNLLTKIKLDKTAVKRDQNPTIATEKLENIESAQITSNVGDDTPKKYEHSSIGDHDQQELKNENTITDLIKFIDNTSPQDLVKLYPTNVSCIIPSFNVSDTLIKNRLLQYYSQRDKSTHNALVKLYQKPQIKSTITIPDIQSLGVQDRKYHEFLQKYYPNSLPFFWYLVNREAQSIRYVVMEFAVDHIIQTNILDADGNRNELSLTLQDILNMSNGVSLNEYFRQLFICFHPQRVSTQNNSKNRYFDYIDNVIRKEATLDDSNILQLWNYMNKSGYHIVAADDFLLTASNNIQNSSDNN